MRWADLRRDFVKETLSKCIAVLMKALDIPQSVARVPLSLSSMFH